MTTVTIERDLANDLFDTKLSMLRGEINNILKKWNIESANKLIKLTREGKLPEAEVDAIVLTNLLSNIEKYEDLRTKLGS